MATEALSGSFLKLRRAREKILELRQLVPDRTVAGSLGDLTRALGYNGYTDGYSFHLINDDSDERTYFTIKMIEEKELIQCLIGEIAYQLRSSLDHAVVSLAKLNSPGHSTKSAYFPICDKSDQVLGSHKISLLSEKAREAIIKLRPHKEEGGNSLLIMLNDIRNLDAHLEVVSTFQGGVENVLHIRPARPDVELLAGELLGAIAAIKIKRGVTLLNDEIRVPFPMYVPEHEIATFCELLYQCVTLSVFFAISSIAECENKPMVPLLDSLADEVERALHSLAECTPA